MHVIHSSEDFPDMAKHGVAAIGNFDGVHKGHQHIMAKTTELARQSHSPSIVVTFEPHPATVLKPELSAFKLTSFEQKIHAIQSCGIDYVLALPFTKALSVLPAETFVETILINHLKLSHIVIGHDFIFGHNRLGNVELLQHYADKHAFQLTRIEAVKGDDIIYSSTAARHAIMQHDLKKAEAILGRPYTLSGVVLHGQKRGTEIGFPTANLDLGEYLRPPHGVYVVQTKIGDQRYPAIANIGTRPTIGQHAPTLEVHVFDYEGILYGHRIEASLLHFLRSEERFSSLEALRQQIMLDCQQAKSYLGLV